jgi:hypothetical protein
MARLAGGVLGGLSLEVYFYPICGLSRKAKPGMKMPYNYFSRTNKLIYPIKISPNKIEPRFYGFDGPRNKIEPRFSF